MGSDLLLDLAAPQPHVDVLASGDGAPSGVQCGSVAPAAVEGVGSLGKDPSPSVVSVDPSFPPLGSSARAAIKQGKRPIQVDAPLEGKSKGRPSFAQVVKDPPHRGFVRSHAQSVAGFGTIPDLAAEPRFASKEGSPAVFFSPQEVARAEAVFSNAVVLKFYAVRPSLEECHSSIASLWGLSGQFAMGLLDSKTLLLRFELEADMILALTRESNYLKSCPFKIYRWHKRFSSKEDAALAPVWISLPHLPIQCFIPTYLKAIVKGLGKFLRMDQPTATLTNPSVAWVCIEVDLSKALPHRIWIGMNEGFWQQVVYERLPFFCAHCNVQGHSSSGCKRRAMSVLPKVNEAPPHQKSSVLPELGQIEVAGNVCPGQVLSSFAKEADCGSASVMVSAQVPERRQDRQDSQPPSVRESAALLIPRGEVADPQVKVGNLGVADGRSPSVVVHVGRPDVRNSLAAKQGAMGAAEPAPVGIQALESLEGGPLILSSMS